MKKMFLVVLLILSMAAMLFAQESEGTTGGETVASGGGKAQGTGFGADIRVGYSFPFIEGIPGGDDFSEESGFAKSLLSIALSSLTVGGGFHYAIIPHVIDPGLYFDISFNFLSWSLMGMFANVDFVMLQTGLRLFNRFSFANIEIDPFFGGNFLYLSLYDASIAIPLLAAGLIFSINKFSFEYGYHFAPNGVSGENISFHRISFSGVVWKK